MTGAESSGTDPRIGTLAAGKYRVLRLIGRGGMGSVYEAQNVAIGKRVALKFLRTPAGADASVRARFHREARAVSAVESAHIVQIFDTGETEAGEPFLVMELLQGEDLATRLRRLGRMSVPVAVSIAAQALRGLRRAHAAGVVHRDLKPQNVFLVDGDDGKTHVKIVDFGLSKVLGGEAELVAATSLSAQDPLTRVGTPVGTPFYMSPEQIEALDDIDPRTDIWSMGAILYETLAGAPPFSEPTFARLVIAICHKDPPDLGSLVPGLPDALRRVVRRAMTRDRGERFPTAEEFLTALLEAVPDVERSQPSGSFRAEATPPRAPLPTSDADTPMNVRPGPTAPGDAEAPPAKSDSGAEPPGAELRTYTVGGATLWLSASPAFSLWRGEVNAPDRLRVETRDGGLFELRLEPVGVLRLGRVERVGDERNELVYPDVASRLAATLRHDGVRWWLRRRTECSVPVQVGAHALARGEEGALVHGTFVQVGGMRATMVDRRYVTPTVPAGTVDTTTGLLGRAGLEQEVASFLQRKRSGALVLVKAQPSGARAGSGGAEYPPGAIAAVALHRASPSVAVGLVEETAVVLVAGELPEVAEKGRVAAASARNAGGGRSFSCGYWTLSGDGSDAGRELELALHAMTAFSETSGQAVAALRSSVPGAKISSVPEVLGASTDTKRTTLLFAIEEQKALFAVGPHVVAALEKELAAVAATHAGQAALVAPLAPGVVAACVTRKVDAVALGSAVQCDWHARPPILDGKVELPRTLSWEVLHGDVQTRAQELARECADPHGVLSALSGGLPYPIAGRVHAAIAASSAIERVKMLFDVLEGTWRFIATVLLSAYFARKPSEGSAEVAPGFDAMVELYRRHGTRDGFALGTWREIARAAAKGFEGRDDPIGALVRDVLGVRLSQNQTFETLSNLMQVERNSFAHGHYNEARAAADLPEFEQMTRTLLRALRPLCVWTLVTVEKTEPDLYGDLQTVEFIDHTGAFNTGTRRRLGLNSPMRLANVTYLARWREGLVLPMEPFLRRVAHEDKFDVYWMEHLPRAGMCLMSSVVGGPSIKVPCDVRRLPPLLRIVMERSS